MDPLEDYRYGGRYDENAAVWIFIESRHGLSEEGHLAFDIYSPALQRRLAGEGITANRNTCLVPLVLRHGVQVLEVCELGPSLAIRHQLPCSHKLSSAV